MSLTVRVNVNATAALLRGTAQSGTADIIITDEHVQSMTSAQRVLLGTKAASSDVNFRIYGDIGEPNVDNLIAYLQRELDESAAIKEREIESVRAWLAGDESNYGPIPISIAWSSLRETNPELMDAAISRCNQRAAERDAREAAGRAAKQKAEDDREAAKQQYIAAFVDGHGSAPDRERLAAGVLPRSEIIHKITDAAFAAALGDTPVDATDSEGWQGLEELPEKAWETFSRIRPALAAAGATFSFVWRNTPRDDYDYDGDDTEDAVKVTLPVGPFKLVRYYKL